MLTCLSKELLEIHEHDYTTFIKGFSTHYFIATRIAPLRPALALPQSLPLLQQSLSSLLAPYLWSIPQLLFPSQVPHPSTRSVFTLFLVPTPESALEKDDRLLAWPPWPWITSPGSTFDFCLFHLLCPPQSFLPDGSPWMNFTFQLPVKRTSGKRRIRRAWDGKFIDVGFGFKAAMRP